MGSERSPASGGPPTTVAEYVLEAVRRGILDGRYPLGSRLDQQALADEYGASIIPVRESLRQLEAEGLVRIAPRRGAFVAELSPRELAEIYDIREVLERLATERAVAGLAVADVADMDRLLKDLERTRDAEAWRTLNRAWHFRLYEAAAAPLLLQLASVLWDRCSLYRHVYPRDPERRQASVADHRRIMDACRAGQGTEAGAAMAEHIRSAKREALADPPC